MAIHQILPAALAYTKSLCDGAVVKAQLGVSAKAESGLIGQLSAATDSVYEKCMQLQEDLNAVPAKLEAAVAYYRNVIVSQMDALRKDADLLEQLTDKKYWPYPTYSDLLFY